MPATAAPERGCCLGSPSHAECRRHRRELLRAEPDVIHPERARRTRIGVTDPDDHAVEGLGDLDALMPDLAVSATGVARDRQLVEADRAIGVHETYADGGARREVTGSDVGRERERLSGQEAASLGVPDHLRDTAVLAGGTGKAEGALAVESRPFHTDNAVAG